MLIIKYFMLFSVFLTATLIGKNISQKYKFRLDELEDIKNALNIFKSKIRFTYEPIPEIFNQISQNTSKNISKLFTNATEKMKNNSAGIAWEESIEEFSGNLNYEDKQAIKTLSKLLRNNRYRRTIESNWSNRKFFERTD